MSGAISPLKKSVSRKLIDFSGEAVAGVLLGRYGWLTKSPSKHFLVLPIDYCCCQLYQRSYFFFFFQCMAVTAETQYKLKY